jgi:hypothetical protein
MQFTPEILRTSVRIVGVCAVVWPTLYILNKNGGNLIVNPNGGNLAVSRDVTRQAVEDAMKPKFDDISKRLDDGGAKIDAIAKRLDDGLAKIDLDVKCLNKDFKKSRKDLDYVENFIYMHCHYSKLN